MTDQNMKQLPALVDSNETCEERTCEERTCEERTCEERTRKERPHYEVVFFVKYNNGVCPLADDVINYFNNYGVVHHVNCPEGKHFAFVFMSSLNTTVEHRRTSAIINQIIKEMSPENHFQITVANSNKNKSQNNNSDNNQNRNNRSFRTNNNYQKKPPGTYQLTDFLEENNRTTYRKKK